MSCPYTLNYGKWWLESILMLRYCDESGFVLEIVDLQVVVFPFSLLPQNAVSKLP
jgi:hypothetical protein